MCRVLVLRRAPRDARAPQCTELILKQNDITNADCEHIKTLLLNNKTLTSLNLEANKIDSEGSTALMAALWIGALPSSPRTFGSLSASSVVSASPSPSSMAAIRSSMAMVAVRSALAEKVAAKRL